MKFNIIKSKLILTLFIFLYVIIWCFLILIKFPGIYNVDSLVILEQIINGKYTDYYPALSTIPYRLIWNITKKPVTFLIPQFFLSLISFYLFINTLDLEKKFKISLFLIILFILNPVILIYNITFWKDVILFYSFFIFILLLINLIINKKSLNLRHFFLISVLIIFSKHNGVFIIFYFFLILILTLFVFKDKKYFIIRKLSLYLFTTTLFFFIFIKAILYPLMKVEPVKKYNFLIPLIHQVFGIIANNGRYTKEQEILFNKIIKNDIKITFVCFTSNYFVFNPTFNKKFIETNRNKILKESISIIIKNPEIVIGNLTCKFLSHLGSRTHFLFLFNSDKSKIIKNKSLIGNKADNVFNKYITISYQNFLTRIFFYKIIIPFILIIFFYFLFKNKFYYFIIFLPYFLNIFVLTLIAPATDYRYVYSFQTVYYLLPLFIKCSKKV